MPDLTSAALSFVLLSTNSERRAMAGELGAEEKLKRLNATAKIVILYFKDEPWGAILWFTTPNPMLGGVTPLYLIESGRHDKVIKFVQSAIEENMTTEADS